MPVFWKRAFHLLFGAIVILTAGSPAYAQTASSSPNDERALDASVQAFCKPQIAMVGEIATHGDGHTLAFKVALVERLVDQGGSLGFSAAAGSPDGAKKTFEHFLVPPSSSVEAQALQGLATSSVYVGSTQLAAMGLRPGAFFIHSYQILAWSRFLDGVVVFQTEHPPTDVR